MSQVVAEAVKVRCAKALCQGVVSRRCAKALCQGIPRRQGNEARAKGNAGLTRAVATVLGSQDA